MRRAGGKWGYIDRSGRMVVPPQFAWAYDFSHGVARVGDGVTGEQVLVKSMRASFASPAAVTVARDALEPSVGALQLLSVLPMGN